MRGSAASWRAATLPARGALVHSLPRALAHFALARVVIVAVGILPLLALRPAPTVPARLSVGRPGAVTVLTAGATWPARSRITLRGPIVVPAGAALTIEPGVTVDAAAGTGIVVERDARVNAQGSLLEPIVFSCTTTPVVPGCWDGLTILGNAPLNHGAATSPAGGRGGAGGCRQSTLDGAPYGGCTATDSSGVLRYVRVQYATHGLRLYGVGSATVLEQLQVHRSLGHGLEVVGGAARLRYLALTTNAQYGLAYRGGWVGQAQFVVIQQDATGYAGGLLGENAASSTGDPNATPRSAPTLANLTIVAPTSAPTNPYLATAPAALRFARGGAGLLYNVLLVEPALGVDVDDASTCTQLSAGTLALRGVVVTSPVSLIDPDADPTECTPLGEAALVSGATTLTGPQLRSPLDVLLPDLRARLGSTLASAAGQAPPAGGVLEAVTYLGAIPPGTSGSEIPWYSGWTLGEQLAPPALVTVTGTVTGTNGRGPLSGVTVRVEPVGIVGVTNGGGAFSIPGVPNGPLTLVIQSGLPGDCTVPGDVSGTADGTPFTLTVTCSPLAPPLSTIAGGVAHTCAIDAGQIYCAGNNSDGELGDGTTTRRLSPVAVAAPIGVTFVQVVAGASTCGLTAEGSAYCWGSNFGGQLGDGTTTRRLTPVRVQAPAGVTFSQLAAGDFHTCGVSVSGGAYCWGFNNDGRLGDGTTTQRLSPVQVAAPRGVTFNAVATGFQFSCALATGGTAYCWGVNLENWLGTGCPFSCYSPLPVSLPVGVNFTQLSTGGSHACGLTAGGALYCWGSNSSGQLGDGTTTARGTPAQVSTPVGVTFARLARSVGSLGADHSCAITTTGTLYCWGANGDGQLGDGTTIRRLTAVQVLAPAGVTFAQATTGRWHTCAVTPAGAVYCWGANFSGQLGDGTLTRRLTPLLVPSW